MKTAILSAALLLSVAATAAASRINPVNEKVMKTFNEVFRNVSTPVWNVAGNYYDAFFVNASVKTRARFDSKGHLVQTIRYYTESSLPANILYKIKRAYQGKEVYGVIETTTDDGINYGIILKGDEKYIRIDADTLGDIKAVAEYNRNDK